MKLKDTPKTITTEGSQIVSHTDETAKELVNLIDNNFLQEHWSEGKQLSRNGHMKSFVLEGRKYISIIGENKQIENSTDMADDVKAWYGAVLEGYKMISDYIYTSYLPGKPPYEIRYPKALAYKHTDTADVLVIEWVDNLVSFEDINRNKAKMPNEHAGPINTFLEDRSNAIADLSKHSGIRKSSTSKSRYRQFIVKMPYGDVVVDDDFGLRLNGNGAEEETLKNGGYIVGRKANEKPVIYLIDGLIASNMKSKT